MLLPLTQIRLGPFFEVEQPMFAGDNPAVTKFV